MPFAGPFESYVAPGVYPRTLTERTPSGLSGQIRMSILVGVGAETLEVSDLELIRGSSSISDQSKSNEDVSSQLTGFNREFIVEKIPIVTGDGTGTTTNNPGDVTVTINGEKTAVAQVVGADGKVILDSLPREEDVVKISYFFSREDTLRENDDLSIQANGVNKDFKVNFVPIVRGDNGGIITTDVTKVTVTVNGVVAVVTELDGLNGLITLAVAPPLGAAVLATYYTNSFQNTFDYLPDGDIEEVIRVGDSPGNINYTETVDFVIEGDKIQWGSSFDVKVGETVFGTEPFDDTQISALLIDNKFFKRPTTGTVDGNNVDFLLGQAPTDGSGRDITTDDVSLFKAYVGADPYTATEVGIAKVSGRLAQVSLVEAPVSGNVYVTYYYNLLTDDVYTFTNKVASTGTTEGDYEIASKNNGLVTGIVLDTLASNVTDPDFATESVTFPAGEGLLNSDAQTIPGFSPEEVITLTFVDAWSYNVTSSLAEGSSGVGYLNQTYVDDTTGVRFTILKGISVNYIAGDEIVFNVSKTFKTGPQAHFALPGLKSVVSNSTSVATDSTALVTTYNKSGLEPAVSDFYYISYHHTKDDFEPKVFNDFKLVENEYGKLSISNKLTLGAYLGYLNGASAIAFKQVIKTPGELDAPASAYIDAIRELEVPLDNDIRPNILIPLTTEASVIQFARAHADKVSSQRYGLWRTVNFGFPVGTSPEVAQATAKGYKNTKMLAVYPDGASIVFTDELGNEVESIVDGSFLAAGLGGLMTNPAFDVAVPLTNKALVGYNRLVRKLDSVAANQTAVAGVTVLAESPSGLLIRDALTTNTTNDLTREPTVIQISHFIMNQTRIVLASFIGVKFLTRVLQDIEDAEKDLLSRMVADEIITAYRDVSAVESPKGPTIADVFAAYSPVFPLKFLPVTYELRSSLS